MAFRTVGIGSVSKVQRPIDITQKDLEELEELGKKHKVMFIKLEPHFGQKVDILEKNGYRESNYPFLEPATVVFDLSLSEKELYKNLSHNCKYSVRRSVRDGTQFEMHQNPSDQIVEIFYKLAKATERDRHFAASPLEDLKTKVSLFGEKSWIALVKNKKNDYTAGYFFLADEGGVWFLHGGTSHKGRRDKSGYTLLWESILYFKKAGIRMLDLGGRDDDRFPTLTKSWAGFSYFKEKFGGIDVYFPEPYVKMLSHSLKFLAKFYKLPL